MCCVVLGLPYVVHAQVDRVELKNGQQIEGEILRYKLGESLQIYDASSKTIIDIEDAEVNRILQTRKKRIVSSPADFDLLALREEQNRFAVRAMVYLKNGTTRKGRIVAYERGGDLQLQITDGSIYTYAESDVSKISHEGGEELIPLREKSAPAFERPLQPYAFKEKGVFHHTVFSFAFGKKRFIPNFEGPIFFPGGTAPEEEIVQRTTSFSIEHISGYQFNRWIGIGAGVSYDAYNLEDGEAIVSIFANYRAYFTATKNAPFISLKAGYGIPAVSSKDGYMEESEGGIMLNPELGIRLGGSGRANFTFALGYRFQDAYLVQEEQFSRDILYRDINYKRFVASVGMLF